MKSLLKFQPAMIVLLLASTETFAPTNGAYGQDGKKPVPASKSVPITITERAGVERIDEYVQFGVPLPREWKVTDVNTLELLNPTGKRIPGQFEVLARWGAAPDKTDAPIKWVLVGCQPSLKANASVKFLLFPNPNATGTKPKKSDEVLPLNMEIRYLPAGELSLVPGGNVDLKPRTTKTLVERTGPLTVMKKTTGSILDARGQAVLDYTARRYYVSGSDEVRLDFTVENNHPVLSSAEDGQPTNAHDQGAPHSVYIGELQLRFPLPDGDGPIQILAEGGVKVDSPKSAVRVYQDSSGLDTWDAYKGLVGWPKEEKLAHPRVGSYCTKRGFEISGGGLAKPVTGNHALGWVTVQRGGKGSHRTVAVRDFWQNFPKAIEVQPDGTVVVNLFPDGAKFKHNFRVGEEKTHTILIRRGKGVITAAEAERRAKAFNHPLVATISPDWYVKTGVLGEIPAADLKKWPLYERYVRTAFEPNPDFDPSKDDPNQGNRTLLDAVKKYNFYGWQDYGDVPLDYEGFGAKQAGQMNLKYWFTYGMFMQFCRSGDARWMDLARPAAWHLADIDCLHVPDEGPHHWCHGAYFGHSGHEEPGNINPNRNHNSPSVDLFFGTPDLLLAYYITGEPRFREVAMEFLVGMKAQSEFSPLNDPVLPRERANMIFAYIEAYRQTGEKTWMDELRKIVKATTNLEIRPWVKDPVAFGKAQPEPYLSMFSYAQSCWALGLYLDFCAEYELKDDLGAAKALDAYSAFMLKFLAKELRPGCMSVPHEYRFGRLDETGEDYLEINNWTLVMADMLAYAYKYTGKKEYLAAAGKFYKLGTEDPQWKGDAPVYIDTKGLVNHCNWGLVYMNQSRKSNGK